jgi:hypothetical protein
VNNEAISSLPKTLILVEKSRSNFDATPSRLGLFNEKELKNGKYFINV